MKTVASGNSKLSFVVKHNPPKDDKKTEKK